MKKEHKNYTPEILGLNWSPGNLIMVASDHWGKKAHFVLGNCIVYGTKDSIPVAYFCPTQEKERVEEILMRMQAKDLEYKRRDFSLSDLKRLPVYIDDTPKLSLDYLISRIFHLKKEMGVQMVAIHYLQAMDTTVIEGREPEYSYTSILRILKALAESLEMVIIVTSTLSHNAVGRRPTLRDILDVDKADEYCDQIVMLHEMPGVFEGCKIILPFGPYYDDKNGEELVINEVWDRDEGRYKKADYCLPEETDDLPYEEEPNYRWIKGENDLHWHFNFPDAKGMGWIISLDAIDNGNRHC